MTEFSERLYSSSPIWLQQVAVAVWGFGWYRRRYNAHFHRLLGEFQVRDRWTAEQFRTYQEEQLARLLEVARRAPYYAEAFAASGVRAGDAPFEALRKLPLLAKETLRTRPRDLLTQNPPPRDVMVFKSSGTTGTPTEIYYPPDFHALELALPAVRNLGWAGIDYRARRVMFGVRKVCRFNQDRPPFWRYSPAENMAYASIYHLAPRFLPAYLAFLREYRPAVIMGYPNSLYTLAHFALDSGDLPLPAQGIFTTSETVTDEIRAALEGAWQCKVYDRYGAVEGCLFASQCEHGRYHVSPEPGIVEILDRDGQPCAPGEIGEVVCTGLQNFLQPLIRYRIGDAARWAVDAACACGRAMPVLESIEGRYEDICMTQDGREVLRFDTVFKGVDAIKEAQVVQESLDRFSIYVVPAEDFGEAVVKTIQQNMRIHVGEVETTVHTVPSIARTGSGKFRAVISKLSSEDKARVRERSRNV
jgi:phenylacetate-CoA ligase